MGSQGVRRDLAHMHMLAKRLRDLRAQDRQDGQVAPRAEAGSLWSTGDQREAAGRCHRVLTEQGKLPLAHWGPTCVGRKSSRGGLALSSVTRPS